MAAGRFKPDPQPQIFADTTGEFVVAADKQCMALANGSPEPNLSHASLFQ
jgi:hypothetical protein